MVGVASRCCIDTFAILNQSRARSERERPIDLLELLFGIGAPVLSPSGRVIASVNLGGPLVRLSRRASSLARVVVAAAGALTADIRRVGGGVRASR